MAMVVAMVMARPVSLLAGLIKVFLLKVTVICVSPRRFVITAINGATGNQTI